MMQILEPCIIYLDMYVSVLVTSMLVELFSPILNYLGAIIGMQNQESESSGFISMEFVYSPFCLKIDLMN